jgi:hypothetical protein
VRSIDEGLILLSDMPADGAAAAESVNEAVAQRLRELALGLKEFSAAERSEVKETKL